MPSSLDADENCLLSFDIRQQKQNIFYPRTKLPQGKGGSRTTGSRRAIAWWQHCLQIEAFNGLDCDTHFCKVITG